MAWIPNQGYQVTALYHLLIACIADNFELSRL